MPADNAYPYCRIVVPGGIGAALKAARIGGMAIDAARAGDTVQTAVRIADHVSTAVQTLDTGANIYQTVDAYQRGDALGMFLGGLHVGVRGVQGVHNAGFEFYVRPREPATLYSDITFGAGIRRKEPNWAEFERLAFGHAPKRERFTLPWTGHSKEWGYREADDWVPSSGTIQEATKLEWHKVEGAHATSEMWDRFTHKLQQADQDGWLLRNDPRVNEVIWYGAELLPTTGRGAELARKLAENGIVYRVIDIR